MKRLDVRLRPAASHRTWLYRALALVALAVALSGHTRVAAYDVCTDDYADKGIMSCAHEKMYDEAMKFYTQLVVPNRFSKEIIDHGAFIRAGVGAPDAGDPLYDNVGIGGALVTITHFWQPDHSFGYPQVQVLDPYPNAFNAAQGLWTRALGEYAAGNKEQAYRFLGMIAHFLGDQTIPAHANGDTHPEDLNDGDPFEEWMSNPALNKANLTVDEFNDLKVKGLIDLPDYENIDKLLWLFLNVNQVAGYFASDDYDGDATFPSDPRYPHADGYATDSLNEVIALCAADGNCPTDADDIQNNDRNTYPYYYNDDNDLDRIRNYSYIPGVRKLAALFTLWEEAIQEPIMTLTVHDMEETGQTDSAFCLGGTRGLDDCGQPDYYLGVVMGDRRRSPVPPGALLESDNDEHSYRSFEDQYVPAASTRTDSNNHIAEDKTHTTQDYHFGQSYKPDATTKQFIAGTDIIDVSFIVRDGDVTMITSSPYGDDDLAFIHPNGSGRVNLEVDLRQCADGASNGINVVGVGNFACAPSTADSASTIRVGGGRGSAEDDYGENSEDVDVRFSVNLFVPDKEPPVITCDAPDGVWHATNVGINCTASDAGSGLANAADASFVLSTSVAAGTETANALTGTREVCDAVGNCTTAGPIGGNKVDMKAPEIVITTPAATEYTHSDTLVLDYVVSDGGSGVDTVTPTMNGSTTLTGAGLPSGRAISLLTELPLGEHTFAVGAQDHVGNVSPTQSVTFSIVVTPESLIEAITIFEGLGDIKSTLVRSLLAKLENAAEKFNAGDCATAANLYGAFINEVQAQTGKGITAFAAAILIADAEYLMANCP